MNPHFGYTRHGLAVHQAAADHLPDGSRLQRFNKNVAVHITRYVGTMTCAYIFTVIALIGLPQAISQSGSGGHFSPLPLVQWVAQTFLQLVLLSVIMVGQNVQQAASDARASKTFEDVERLAVLLDAEGGIASMNARLDRLLAISERKPADD